MDKDQLVKRLMQTFLQELEEHVGALNRDLLALEKGPASGDREKLLLTLFRTAHSLKGAARSVNVELIERASHQLEDILSGLRDGRLALNAELFRLLFAAADGLEQAAMQLREERDLSATPLTKLLPELKSAAAHSTGGTNPSGVGEVHGEIPAEQPPDAEVAIPAATSAGGSGEAAPQPRSEAGPEITGQPSLRVPAEKLDMFLAQSGELVIARRRIQERVQDLAAFRDLVVRARADLQTVDRALKQKASVPEFRAPRGDGPSGGAPSRVLGRWRRTNQRFLAFTQSIDQITSALVTDASALDRSAGALDSEIRRIRMLPFIEACEGMDRLVRDLAHAAGKEAALVCEGNSVELDRAVLEGLKDPLRHLVRNAVDHGIETPADRVSQGKPSRGRIVVSAVLRGDQVEINVADDGRGIDLTSIREQLVKKGNAEPADDRELARLVFSPGLSTAELITDVSGRGMGLDVVRSRIESLQGIVDLSFVPGRGTRFTLTVPLTLTTMRALLLTAGGRPFALPGISVKKLVRAAREDFRSIEGRHMLLLDGAPVPVATLAETLGLPRREQAAPSGKVPVAVVMAGDKCMAIAAEELLNEQSIVIKNFGPRVRHIRLFSGATILSSGQIALVINAAELIGQALARSGSRVLGAAEPRATAKPKRRILIVEDSMTTRTLEKSILEAAGYEVLVAPDGQSGWMLLQEQGVDLVVSDVEMPLMDGFTLTEAVRGSARFSKLPVVLVTARETEQDKERGMKVGADAYLVKSAFDQRNLLDTIGQLI